MLVEVGPFPVSFSSFTACGPPKHSLQALSNTIQRRANFSLRGSSVFFLANGEELLPARFYSGGGRGCASSVDPFFCFWCGVIPTRRTIIRASRMNVRQWL